MIKNPMGIAVPVTKSDAAHAQNTVLAIKPSQPPQGAAGVRASHPCSRPRLNLC
jgi:hypothetical protein